MAVSQHTKQAHKQAEHATQDWSSGLFDCFRGYDETLSCATAWFCPCYVYGKIHQKVIQGVRDQGEVDRHWHTAACTCILCPICSFWPQYKTRRTIRALYNLHDEPCCTDCFIVTHCCCCAFCQQWKQLKLPRADGTSGAAGPGNGQAVETKAPGVNKMDAAAPVNAPSV